MRKSAWYGVGAAESAQWGFARYEILPTHRQPQVDLVVHREIIEENALGPDMHGHKRASVQIFSR